MGKLDLMRFSFDAVYLGRSIRNEIGSITELKGGMFNSAYMIERIKENDKIVLKVSI